MTGPRPGPCPTVRPGCPTVGVVAAVPWSIPTAAVDSGGGPAVDSGGGPAVDSGGGSSVKDLERTLSFTGPGGGEWLHVVRRASGATAASVLTVNRHATHAPPYQSKLVSNVLPGQCKSWHLTGTVSGGDPFTTTVTYCVDGDQVTISHTSAINGTPSGTTQQHGAVSLAPDAAAPYERSLHFVGTGGTEWLHLASQAAGETVVNVRTISYSAALVPPVRDRTVSDIAPLACKIDLLTGTFAVGGGSFSTELKHCRTANAVVIEHAATSGGTNSAWQAHGSIPLH